jgi:hypothetical protein
MDTGEMWRRVQRAEDQKEIDGLEVRIGTLSGMLKEVACSGVEGEYVRSPFVLVQIDKDLWDQILAFQEYKPVKAT